MAICKRVGKSFKCNLCLLAIVVKKSIIEDKMKHDNIQVYDPH